MKISRTLALLDFIFELASGAAVFLASAYGPEIYDRWNIKIGSKDPLFLSSLSTVKGVLQGFKLTMIHLTREGGLRQFFTKKLTFSLPFLATFWIVAVIFLYYWVWKLYLHVVRRFKRSYMIFVVYALLCQFAITMLFKYFFMTFCEPYSSKELDDQVKRIFEEVGFPDTCIYVMSNMETQMGDKEQKLTLNAFFVGSKDNGKVVFTEDMLKESPPEEIIGILYHEIGHWYYSHIFTRSAASMVLEGILAMLSTYPLDRDSDVPLPLQICDNIAEISSPAHCLTKAIFNIITQYHELQADSFAKDHGSAHGLSASLIRMALNGKTCPDSNRLYSATHETHPSYLHRIRTLRQSSV